MKTLFKLAGVLAMAGVLASCSNAKKTVADYRIIPLPQEITQSTDGSFELNRSVKIIYPENNEAMRRNAGYLADYLKKATGTDYAVEAGTEGKGNILLMSGLTSENPEAYKLQVTPDGVTITGASEAGVFYGIQTLRKAIPMEKNSVPVLSAVEINDYPRFGYRGAHIDVARHFFTVDEMKTFIDMMALHNMNRLHWHLTEDQGWRLEIKKYPLLTEIGSKRKETVIGRNSGKYDGKPYEGFYTQEEAKDIVAYIVERYITVIPEIDLPGHMQAALASYPHLGCTGGPYEVW
uniref:beta-N-acetylhexosaminidase n=1 Tax=Prevotella heparinolytica TaxID=28113 RepID=UPI00359F3B27